MKEKLIRELRFCKISDLEHSKKMESLPTNPNYIYCPDCELVMELDEYLEFQEEVRLGGRVS